MAEMRFGGTAPPGSAGSSLLAHRVQVKDSPTYAEPKEGGRVSCVEGSNGSVTYSVVVKEGGRHIEEEAATYERTQDELVGGVAGGVIKRCGS